MDQTDPPNSICHVQAIQMYQLPQFTQKVMLPFNLLHGEAVVHTGNSVDGLLVLTNYRLYLQLRERQHHVPLGLIEVVEHRELFYLHIGCKDARTYRCTFDNNENCLEWFGRLLKASAPPRQLEELFAFFYYAWSKEKGGDEVSAKLENQKSYVYDENAFRSEVDRLQFDLHGVWRISSANKNYELCPSYPLQLLVPSCITDETLEIVAKFRSSRRIPAVVWRHVRNGAVIARCSQPEVGWFGWRSGEDEDLLKAICDACSVDRGPKTIFDRDSNLSHSPTSHHSEETVQTHPEINIQEKKKVLIMDARSYTTAVANRARGGGCECPEYYPSCEIQFMYLANIHSIRKSFHALRQLCTSSADQPNWFSQLEGTRWLQHMSGLMKSAVTLVTAVECDARPVLVHCSDGWDRTPQIVSLAELLLDPFYRTVDGFRILIEREWLAFGHKFADRCGHATGSEDQNERCPVFLQWLDCVHQLLLQFPCAFEFSQTYLVKLAQHTYSNLFGTFICNTKQERAERVNDNTFSVWGFLNSLRFRNHLYSAPGNGNYVLWPQHNIRDLQLWSEVYLGSLETQTTPEGSSGNYHGPPDLSPSHMTKTRSYGDLVNATDVCAGHFRRCSDPNITLDIKLHSVSVGEYPQNATNSSKSQQSLLHRDVPIIGLANGRITPMQNDFLINGSEVDDGDCNNDCIYKKMNVNGKLEEEGVDLLVKNGSTIDDGGEDFRLNLVVNGNTNVDDDDVADDVINNKTEKHTTGGKELLELEQQQRKAVNDFFSRVTSGGSDINHNGGDLKYAIDDGDSDTECITEPSDGRSENTICCSEAVAIIGRLDVEKSVETSTETLVSENVICSSSPNDANGFEKLSNQDVCNGNADICRICSIQQQNSSSPPPSSSATRYYHEQHHNNQQQNGKTSRYSTPPSYSRTSSTNGWDRTLSSPMLPLPNEKNTYFPLGDDGLVPLKSDLQDRLWQIIQEHKRKEEALQKELHTYRKALIKRVCHRCSHNDADRQDDASSVVDSLCSVGEGQASAVESLRSDMSWEALEEGSTLPDSNPTLWVPDHAVSRCTGCQTEFWLGRRKHHCRNCGRIFCADCSENSTPLPSEHLYDPVRVCTTCYSKLRRDCGEIPDQCKHTAGHHQSANNNPQQIAASSN